MTSLIEAASVIGAERLWAEQLGYVGEIRYICSVLASSVHAP